MKAISLTETIREDCALWMRVHNGDKLLRDYLCLQECANGLYQLILNGSELYYGTLQEINAVVKALLRLIMEPEKFET